MTQQFTRRSAAGQHPPEPPQWQPVGGYPPVPVEQFGKDHWSTFAYVETRAVDHRGLLDHDHMRCDTDRHPMLATAGRHNAAPGLTSAQKYATRLRRLPDQPNELPDHDDYDCLDDLVAAGLLTVTMPTADNDLFTDATGRILGEFDARFLTGMQELRLAAHATWSLTDRGQRLAARLRAHKAAGGSFGTFRACPQCIEFPMAEQCVCGPVPGVGGGE